MNDTETNPQMNLGVAIKGAIVTLFTLPGLVTMALAGACATVAFDFFGQSLSPMLGFANLAPVPLANNVIQTLFGATYRPGAEFLHYFAGMVAYPLGWMVLARPIAHARAGAWLGGPRRPLRRPALDLCALCHGASRRRQSRLPRLHRHHLGRARRSRSLRARRRLGGGMAR